MKIPQLVRELLPKAPLAHLTTLNSDGGPQVTVVWVGIENEEFVIATCSCVRKSRTFNATTESRCPCLVMTNAKGMDEYEAIYGNARVTEGDAVNLCNQVR